MLSVPLGWYASQKKTVNILRPDHWFPQCWLADCSHQTVSKYWARREANYTLPSRAFRLAELENCMNWLRPLLSNAWHVARILFSSPEPVDSWSRGLRYKLSRVALGTRIPGHSFKPRPNRCVLSTAGTVMTVGLSINRCEHSKNPFLREKTRLTSLGCGHSSSIKNTKESRETKWRV